MLSDHMAFWKKFIKSRIHQFEEKTWWDRLTKDYEQKKTRTYITFKNKLCLDPYLVAGSNANGRAFHTALRSGTSVLEIEKGRWQGLEAEDRICPHCLLGEVENEFHFIIDCRKYDVLRNKFYSSETKMRNLFSGCCIATSLSVSH